MDGIEGFGEGLTHNKSEATPYLFRDALAITNSDDGRNIVFHPVPHPKSLIPASERQLTMTVGGLRVLGNKAGTMALFDPFRSPTTLDREEVTWLVETLREWLDVTEDGE
jgi:hypothetical protein